MYSSRYAANTQKKINWVVKLFNEWKDNRNSRAALPGSKLVPILSNLNDMTVDEVKFSMTLCRFIIEV